MTRRGIMRLAALVMALLTSSATVAVTPAAAQRDEIRSVEVDCSAGTKCTVTWEPAVDAEVYVDIQPDVATENGLVAEGDGTATVEGADPTQRYYFLVTTGAPGDGVVAADRSLHLERAPNARDIGGYETRDGRHVRWGTVYRSDAISETTPADDAKLANLGVRLVCDFRGDSEIEADGPDRLPPGAATLHLPVLDEASNGVADEIRTAVTGQDPAALEALLGDGKAERLLVDGGEFFVTNDNASEQFGLLLERLTEPDALPTITHCTAGKDRTGWSTAVILTALGVPKKTVMADYLLTNEYVAERNAEQLQAVEELTGLSELIEPVLEVRREYLNASFAAVQEEYGSFARYLREGLGVDKATLKQLKQTLLTD